MRVHNFNAGPAVLPLLVLEKARSSLMDTAGSGMSILEWSHRSVEYDRVRFDAEARLRRLMGLPAGDPYVVLFLQGGASLQFAQVPMNFATSARPGEYIVTGTWAKKAFEEAQRLGRGRELWSGKSTQFTALPSQGARFGSTDASYVHLCTNNTVYGTQWNELPDTGSIPLICDMSSDVLSRPRAFGQCAMIYAGAQKNLGPAGLTVVVLRKDLLSHKPENLPMILDYRAHVEAEGLYNTPPTFAVYLMDLVLEWMETEGGLEAIAAQNEEKAALVYAAMDRGGFYRGTVAKEARSRMNLTFRLQSEALEKDFLSEATKLGFVGLKGHRSVGGVRASLYNAQPKASVEALVAFMSDFERRRG